jgi:hypothetical protein
VLNGVAQYPVCGDAFAIDFSAGYNFMSVLTHTMGRFALGPRPHVCGYGSETWNGAATVWDQPIDWPTTNVTWNVTFVAQGTVYTEWNATFTSSGSQITARGIAWNAVLPPGQSTHSIGFCANR